MSNSPIVRILQIKLAGFKNTAKGIITMPSNDNKDYFSYKSDILGIYGQNGTGKTAIIEAMGFIQTLLLGKQLQPETVHYISENFSESSIIITFMIDANAQKARVEYIIEFKKESPATFSIKSESLNAALWDGEKFAKKKEVICFTAENLIKFTPDHLYKKLTRNENSKLTIGVNTTIAQKEKRSAIFNMESMKFFLSALNKNELTGDDTYAFIINSLLHYAHSDLFIISNILTGLINLNIVLPIVFREEENSTISKGELPICLDAPILINAHQYKLTQIVVKKINTVLSCIIPNLYLEIYDLGKEIKPDGTEAIKIQLHSKRANISIPVKYESSGIIKIISILNALIYVYSNPSACLIVDELDAGIFEYLLGELLSIFEKNAKGQLIFTSHNLRPLEMLHKSNIIFSTSNAENRYIRLKNIKTNNNLRDVYLRSIILGGQDEPLYFETDSIEIARAFRQAGKVVFDAK